MARESSQHEGVYISGLGPVTRLGLGVDEMIHKMAVRSVLQSPDGHDADASEVWCIPDFDLEELLPAKRPYLDPHTRCALAAAALAIEGAGIQPDEVEPARCGVAFGTMLGNFHTAAMFRSMIDAKGMRLGSPVLFGHTYPNTTCSMMAIEFKLQGCHQNICGDMLSGAQALEAAWLALRKNAVDVILAGGADVVGAAQLERMRPREAAPDSPPPAEGAAVLVLESRESIERREGFTFCELGSVVCRGTQGRPTVEGIADALRGVIADALAEADVWEGDIGVVFASWPHDWHPVAHEAMKLALNAYSEVPVHSGKPHVGETFAAGFPLECAAAADVLNVGVLPPDVSMAGRTNGVEFWVERHPEPLMAHAALVIGATDDLVAAAVLRGL
jgi:3-oxoacyl-[acyl-carrier-protein] synthase II